MATYDPQRSRSRHRVDDADGPAPVDALLGSVTPPAPEAEKPVADTEAPTSTDATDVPDAAETSEPVADTVAPAAATTPPVPPERAATRSREPLVVDLDAPAPAGNGRPRGAAARAALVAVLVAMVAALALWWRRHRTTD